MRRLFLTVLLAVFTTAVAAEPTSVRLEVAGQTFNPKLHYVGQTPYFNLDDQEIVSLLSRSQVTLQRSGTGQTLFAFAPGRETAWSANSGQVRVNGEQTEAPGRYILQDSALFIEPSALYYALALKGVQKSSSVALYPVITDIKMSATGFLLQACRKPTPKVSQKDGVSTVTLEGFCWDRSARSLKLGETSLTVSGGADQNRPLTLTFHPPAFQKIRATGYTLLNESKLDLVQDVPDANQQPEVELLSLQAERVDGSPTLLMEFERSTRLHYQDDTQRKKITLAVPKATTRVPGLSSSDWPGLTLKTLKTGGGALLTIELDRLGPGYRFIELEDRPHVIGIQRVERAESALAIRGSVETPGWQTVRGTIVIDPGHGGSDPGCVNRALGTRESDVNLAISKNLAEILRASGWEVILTRETDRDVTYAGSPDRLELEARSGLANEIGADLFISIHCDASVGPSARGSSVHWWKAEDYELAQSLEHVLGPALGFAQRGLVRNRFVVLRHAQMPSVLIETAFLTNPIEGAMLSDPKVQLAIAHQLAGGLASYMQGRYASRGQLAE